MTPLAYAFSDYAQQVVAGLSTGGVFALLALAVVIIYRSTGVINFAQGEMATFASFVAYSLMQHMSYWPAFALTCAIAFAGGVAVERAVIRPVARSSVVIVVIVTLGLALVFNGASARIWGGAVHQFDSPFSTRPVRVAGVAFSIQDLGIIGVSLVLVLALWLLFEFSKLGLALRAAALNPEASRYVGVRVGRMLALGWGLAATVGAVAGMLTASALGGLEYNMMLTVLLYAFAAAVLGGLDSPFGAVAGGLTFGVLLNLMSMWHAIGSQLKLPVALAVIVLVLVVRPSGLFGRAVGGRV